MAVNKKLNNNYFASGFELININKLTKLGIFINEGYTELLNSKYFCDTGCYEIQKIYLRLLEIIIHPNLMEKMYFNSDLLGLMNELIKYGNTLDDVIKFIKNTDFIHKNLYSISLIKRIKLKKAFIETNDFMITTYYKKLKLDDPKNHENYVLFELFIKVLKSIKLDIGYNDKYIKDINTYKEKKLTNN